MLKKMHGKTEHLGKRPRVSGVERELIYEYKRLLAEKERPCSREISTRRAIWTKISANFPTNLREGG